MKTIMATCNTTVTKPTVWFHGTIEEDPLVGFRIEQMKLIREHFDVISYKQLKEIGTDKPTIVGIYSSGSRAALPLLKLVKKKMATTAGSKFCESSGPPSDKFLDPLLIYLPY